MTALRLREFDLDRDFEAVQALWHAAAGVHVGTSDTREALALKLTRDPDLFLLAEIGGRLVGAVLGGFDGRRGFVYHLAVDDAHHRQRIGSLLMDELERRFAAKGCLKVYLLVVPGNEAALAFYRQRGWSAEPLTFMSKRLT
jgi:ribosomal protein S18 acetylase RimI-like enzyme